MQCWGGFSRWLFRFHVPSRYGVTDREESLRRTRGEAVGVKLGPTPVDRWAVNVGSVLRSPYLLGSRSVDGQVHCRLMDQGVAEPS